MQKAYQEKRDLYAEIGSACFHNNYEDKVASPFFNIFIRIFLSYKKISNSIARIRIKAKAFLAKLNDE